MSSRQNYIKLNPSDTISNSLIKDLKISKSKQELTFLSELKGNMLYRKRKIDEFVKVTKISNKPPVDLNESSTNNSEDKKIIVKDREKKYFLKLNYKAVIDKRSKTQRKKRNLEPTENENVEFHRKIVELNTKKDPLEVFSRTVKNIETFEGRINQKEGANAIYYSLLTNNSRILDNCIKQLNGKDKEYEMLLVKIYKECFNIEKSKLNVDYFYNKIKEKQRKIFKSSSINDLALPHLNRTGYSQKNIKQRSDKFPNKIEAIRNFSFNFNYKVKDFSCEDQKTSKDGIQFTKKALFNQSKSKNFKRNEENNDDNPFNKILKKRKYFEKEPLILHQKVVDIKFIFQEIPDKKLENNIIENQKKLDHEMRAVMTLKKDLKQMEI